MHDSLSGRLLHLRSINHLLRDHHVTYVAARILAESVHPEFLERWTSDLIHRKAITHRRQVYWKYWLFKGFDDFQNHDYRECVIGSPTTHLIEVWLISRLLQEECFSNHQSVYSYSKPKNGDPYIYDYYIRGYKKRELDIIEVTRLQPDSTVLIFDLKAFYPNIDIALAIKRFRDRIERTTLLEAEQQNAIRCLQELMSIENVRGVPIGPPLSHLVANVYLEEFDRKLYAAFPGRYFRYVDDIALVVPNDDAEIARNIFERVVAEEGLTNNPGKLDEVSAAFFNLRTEHDLHKAEDSFGQILSDLRIYLAHNNDDFDRVRQLFHVQGFRFPFFRLKAVASNNHFKRFINRLWLSFGGLFGQSIARPNEILVRVENLKKEMGIRLYAICNNELPSKGLARRWAIQECRFVLNRMLYLAAHQELANILSVIPKCDELEPTRVVYESLATGDATKLLKYPGPTVAAFCQLWTERNDQKPTITWSEEPGEPERDSAAILALYGLCTPPSSRNGCFEVLSNQVFLRLASGDFSVKRTFDDFSYIDEIDSLCLTPDIDFRRLLNSRFDDSEEVFLPALSIGGDAYSS